MKIAACYIRVSTDDQLEYSPDSQLEAIKRYAKQNDMLLLPEYIFIEHDGVSGRKANTRPEFQRMIGTAKTKPKPFDVLLLWKFSRFARNREDSIVYKSMLRKQCGIEVVSVSEPVGDDKMSIIFEAMIEAMDEYYSINLGEEVRRGMTEKTRRGEYVSNAPYGYRIENKKLVVIPEEAAIVREVFTKYANNEPFRQIALWLNDMNVKSRRGNQMQKKGVIYMLRNEVYHGYVHWTPTGDCNHNTHHPDTMHVKGVHEAIISDDLWTAVQDKLTEHDNKYSKYARWTASDAFILSGIVRCAECGHVLAKSTRIYMHCSGYSKGKCSHTQFARIEDMLQMLMIALDMDIASGNFTIDSPKPVINVNTDIIQAQLNRELKKLERAKQAYLDGIDTADEYKHNKKALQAEIDRLQAELDTIPESVNVSDLPERSRNVLEILQSDATNAEKNLALKSLLSKAVYSRENHTLQLFYH